PTSRKSAILKVSAVPVRDRTCSASRTRLVPAGCRLFSKHKTASTVRLGGSARCVAAVDHEFGAGDEAGGVGGEVPPRRMDDRDRAVRRAYSLAAYASAEGVWRPTIAGASWTSSSF